MVRVGVRLRLVELDAYKTLFGWYNLDAYTTLFGLYKHPRKKTGDLFKVLHRSLKLC